MLSWVFAYVYVMTQWRSGEQHDRLRVLHLPGGLPEQRDRHRRGGGRGAARPSWACSSPHGCGCEGVRRERTRGLRSRPRAPAESCGRRSAIGIGAPSRQLIMLIFTALAAFPIYFMLVNAFKSNAEYVTNAFGPPHDCDARDMRQALSSGSLYRWLSNSALITARPCGISTALAALRRVPDRTDAVARGSLPARRAHRAHGGAAHRAGHPALPEAVGPAGAQHLPER